MAKHKVDTKYFEAIAPNRYAINGRQANPTPWRVVGNGLNFVSTYLRKQVFLYSYALQQIPSSSSGNATNLFFLFRTGENVGRIVAYVGLAPADSSAATYDPRVTLQLVHSGGTLTSTAVRYTKTQTNPTPNYPQDIMWMRLTLDTDDGLAANTQYRGGLITADRGKIISACVYEEAPTLANDATTGVCNPKAFEVGGFINTSDIQDVITTGTKLWQHNRGQLISYSPRSGSLGAPNPSNTTPGSTWANIYDFTQTTVTANTRGWRLFNQYMGGPYITTVPLEMGVYAARNAGDGELEVRLVDSTGAWITTTGITGTGTPYVSNTGRGSARTGGSKCDLQCRVVNQTTATNFTIRSIGVWLYET